jgi:hypothetical protein
MRSGQRRLTGKHRLNAVPLRKTICSAESRVRKEGRDPVRVLRRKVRTDVGSQESMSLAVREALRAQYAGHMSWSVALHHVNLQALAEQRPETVRYRPTRRSAGS